MIVFQILLALAWMVINNAYTLIDFVVGMVVAFLAIYLSRRLIIGEAGLWQSWFSFPENRKVLVLIWRWFLFIGFGLWSIIKSNIDVARIVISPKPKFSPGIVRIPLDLKSDAGITTLANIITLTPGTVTLDVASDRNAIYIHTLNVDDPELLCATTKSDFERRIRELLP